MHSSFLRVSTSRLLLPFLIGALGPAASACGDETTTAASESHASLPIVGSYALTLHDVVVTAVGPSDGERPAPPAEGHIARLDIRGSEAAGYEAILTPRWGQPASYQASLTASTITLTGEGSIEGDGQRVDRIREIRLGRDGATLTGAAEILGAEDAFTGDQILGATLHGAGTVARDEAPPDARVVATSEFGPTGVNAILPWDPFAVSFSEGIDAAKADVSTGDAPFVIMADPAGAATMDGSAWAGSVRRYAVARDWTTLTGDVHVTASNMIDPSGNTTAAWGAPVPMLHVPHADAFTFDDDQRPLTWGAVTFHAPSEASDLCEHDGCAVIPMPATCGEERAGFAGVLPSAKRVSGVKFRYRVMYEDAARADHEPGPITEPFSVQVVGDLGAGGGNPILKKGSAKPLATPRGALKWATDWDTLAVPVSGAAVGFAVRPHRPSCGLSDGTPSGQLVIDAITIE